MDETTALTVKRYFKEYYFKHGSNIKSPSQMESREFGYFPFGGGMIRHLSFNDIGTFRALLVKEAPAGVYCSNSLYTDPSAEMTKKGWLKADLIFDIDADALNLPCKKDHDTWVCKQCGKKEFGLRPEMCPACKGTRLQEVSWTCPLCLDGTKRETYRLLDFLEKDFGIDDSIIQVFFSGNAGYHIQMEGSALEKLDQHGRSEIADYLTAQGIELELFDNPKISPNDAGWRGRIARYIRDLPPETPPFSTSEYNKRVAELTGKLKKPQAIQFLETAVKESSVRIDAAVTTDIHRIFRMPETLNNKTGFVKRYVVDLSAFDPTVQGIALPEENELVEVKVESCPKIILGGNTYGPFKEAGTAELPLFVAIYLALKGAAKIVGKLTSAANPARVAGS